MRILLDFGTFLNAKIAGIPIHHFIIFSSQRGGLCDIVGICRRDRNGMLIGVTLATAIDATILYKCFDTPMFPAEGAWPPGVATAETLLVVVNKGRRALLLLVGMGMGVVGKMIGLPMDLLGVSWFGNFAAMMGLGVGSLVIGSVKTNAFGFKLFGHSFVLVSDMFGAGYDTSHLAITYLGHGLMIGAGMVSLIQAARMLMQKDDGESSAASRFTSSMKNMRNAMGLGYIAYAVVALGIAIVSGLLYEMSIGMFVAWILFAAVAALVSEIMVGIAAMHSGWFPGFARFRLSYHRHADRLPCAAAWHSGRLYRLYRSLLFRHGL